MSYTPLTASVTTSSVLGVADGVPLEIAPGVLLLLGQESTEGVAPWSMDGLYLRAGWLRNIMENNWLNEAEIEGEYIAASEIPIERVKPSLRFFDPAVGQWKLKPSISRDGTFAGIKESLQRWI